MLLEGRRQARHSETFPVRISSEEKPLAKEACSTQNLSSLGARVLSKRTWLLNSRVTLKSLDGDLWARARVVYCQPIGEGAFAVGLEFLS